MIWFTVDLEIFIRGKSTEYVNALNKVDAEAIAIETTSKKFDCSLEHIEVVSCKENLVS